MRKVILLVLAAVLLLSFPVFSYGAGYSDIKSTNWAYEAVNAMSDKAIISGYPDGSFKPNNTVTTGEFVKMALIAATGEDAGNSTSGNWAENYYNKALGLKYFTEYDIAKPDLNKQITRARMALIISSILGDVKVDKYDEIQKGITDITYKTNYEYDITKAYASGILTGYTNNTFRPEKTLSRAEAATVIYRLVDESKRVLPDGGKPADTQKPIDEVITNLDSFYTENGYLDNFLVDAETYVFDTNSANYQMTLAENRGTKWIHFPASVEKDLGRKYFVKDNKIVELLNPTPLLDGSVNDVYKYDITTVDYIASLDTETNQILLIANPFKK